MAFEKFHLDNKTALITGAAGLLGVEHALALLDSGAKVILTDIDEQALQKAYKFLINQFETTNVIVKVMDVSNYQMITSVAHELISNNIRVDILLNNAALDPKVKDSNIEISEPSRLENFSFDQWNLEIAIGLTGAFYCSKVFGTSMAEDEKGGVILNIASDLSVISPDQRLYRKSGLLETMQPVKPVTYSVIKTGLIGLTRYLATYWADKNVRCNALSPGGVFDGQNKEFTEQLISKIPLGRMATKNEYHAAVQFLCSDASSYMNGQNIVMDGGRSIW